MSWTSHHGFASWLLLGRQPIRTSPSRATTSSRRALEALIVGRTPIALVTKGPMVVRDADLLSDLGRKAGCSVCVSVPTVDEDAWAKLEPGTAHPLQRLRAVRTLREAGVNAGVLMAPIVPGFTTQPAKLEATIKAVADHGAAFMGVNLLHLKGGTKDHFMGFLAREHPELVDGYKRLYPGAYAPSAYKDAVRQLVRSLQERHDVHRRTYEAPSGSDSEEAVNEVVEQGELNW